ncbi:MAG: hypothetical protein ISR65_10660 [Bacteriovoracaceae bacterium]|nr:hypothetical protein [Bacteriovoracaceae bacterium]
MPHLKQSEINKIKSETSAKMQATLRELEHDVPSLAEGAGAVAGAALGGAGSLFVISRAGMVPGLSNAGINSGIAAIGGIIGGGAAVGVSIMMAPVAALGVGGYYLMKKQKIKQQKASLSKAISSLYHLQKILMEDVDDFRKEIIGLKVLIQSLKEIGIAKDLV